MFKRTARPGGDDDTVEPEEHIAELDAAGAQLAAAAQRAGLDAPVPGCPLWKIRELLRHTGYVHRWAAGYVAHGYQEEVGRRSEEELLRDGPGDRELLGWFRDGHAGLVSALRSADPALSCWAVPAQLQDDRLTGAIFSSYD